MDSPTISVITPSYNQSEFIEETIESMSMQEYDRTEHIVVDGDSTDGTKDILEKHEDKSGFWWVSEPDNGQAHAIEKGYEMASGDVYCWLNSDDIYLSSEALGRIARVFEQYDTDIVTGCGMEINRRGEWKRPINVLKKHRSPKFMQFSHTILQPATFVRARAATSVEMDQSLTYAFDWDYFSKLFQKFDVMPIDDYIAGYRMYGDNKTARGGLERAWELKQVTANNLGSNSWQSQYLNVCCRLLQASNLLPGKTGDAIERTVDIGSAIVKKLTFHRVTTV